MATNKLQLMHFKNWDFVDPVGWAMPTLRAFLAQLELGYADLQFFGNL